MSEPPSYSPESPQTVIPVAPIPVTPIAWPEMPASMMPSPRRRKPGIITAMGVISIIVACLSGVTSMVVTVMSFGMLVASRSTPATWTPPTPPPRVTSAHIPGGSKATAVVAGVPVDPAQSEDGIDENARSIVMMGMTRARSLDDARQKQLDLLLAVAGRSIFPFVSGTTTPQTIRANVSESGQLPSASRANGPDYYIVGTGRVEVYDEHAIFRPDGSPAVVSVMAPTGDGNAAANAETTRPDPNAPAPLPPGIPPLPTPTPIPNPLASIDPTASTLTMVEGMASMLLALFLLIAGIVTLRSTRSGRGLHWTYVAIKIPLVALAVLANVWMVRGFATGVSAAAIATAANAPAGAPPPPGAAAAGSVTAVAITWIVILACAALAYPVSLLFVLLSKTVREYYKPIAE